MGKDGLKWIEPRQDDLDVEASVPRSKPLPETSPEDTTKGDSLSWEQVQAQNKTAWEDTPADLWGRSGITESHTEAHMEMLKHALPRTLCGGELALSYIDLCKLLTMPVRWMPGAAVEYLDNPEEQRLGVNKHQREHFNTWWKQQEHVGLQPLSRRKTVRGHASIKGGDVCLLRHGNGTYMLCQLLWPEISSSGCTRTVKEGYEEWHGLTNRKNEATPLKEIIVSVQRLARLAPIAKEEPLKIFITYNLGVPRPCCPKPPSDTAKQDNDAPDLLQKRGLQLAETVKKRKDT